MNRKPTSTILALVFAVAFWNCPLDGQEPRSGDLILVGGGGTPSIVMEVMIDLVEGGTVLVVPFASNREKAGIELVDFFQSHGAGKVESLSSKKESEALAQIKNADLIWFGGGSQTRLMRRLPQAYVSAIRDRYLAGCHVGGTSAGAAVMSARMLTGQADLESIKSGQTELAPGLGLTSLIVDQHFHRRRRFNRLMSAVLDHPGSIGIGIDERTAVIVRGGELEVLGESSVLVLDSTQASVDRKQPGEISSTKRLSVHLLGVGQKIELPNPTTGQDENAR